MTLFRSPSTNFWLTTLNGSTTDVATTITLNSVTGLRAPGVLIIDRQDSSGNNTPTLREVISFTGVSGSNITGVTRGVSSTTNQSHSSGALVEAVLETSMWDGFISAATVVMTADGVLNSVLSPMSIARAQITQMALSSVASINTLFVSTNINTSGASVVGNFFSEPLEVKNLVATSIASVARGEFACLQAASVASISLPSNVSTLLSKVIYFTRDMTAATGDVAYTGVGFTPKSIIFLGSINGTATGGAIGLAGSGITQDGMTIVVNGALNFGAWANATTACFSINNGAGGTDQTAKVKTFDADGFTITWTKNGSPTGTGQVIALCLA